MGFTCKYAVFSHFSPVSTPPITTTAILSLISILILISRKVKISFHPKAKFTVDLPLRGKGDQKAIGFLVDE